MNFRYINLHFHINKHFVLFSSMDEKSETVIIEIMNITTKSTNYDNNKYNIHQNHAVQNVLKIWVSAIQFSTICAHNL